MSLVLLEKDPGLAWMETQLPMGGEGDEKGGGIGHGSRPMGGEGVLLEEEIAGREIERERRRRKGRRR